MERLRSLAALLTAAALLMLTIASLLALLRGISASPSVYLVIFTGFVSTDIET